MFIVIFVLFFSDAMLPPLGGTENEASPLLLLLQKRASEKHPQYGTSLNILDQKLFIPWLRNRFLPCRSVVGIW